MAGYYLLLLIWTHTTGVAGVVSVSKVIAQTGGTVTIPCLYDAKYKENVKYWCRGYTWATCRVMGRTSNPHRSEDLSITDDPAQAVFTVTMRNLKGTDSNKYWCAVQVGGFEMPDIKASLFITVFPGVPGLTAESNRVNVQPGGSANIRCLCTGRYTHSTKRWCRAGDWRSCLTHPSQHASVQLSDSRSGVFSVTLGPLESQDTGWYWCAAGDAQAPVYISVAPNTTNSQTPSQTTLSVTAQTHPTLPVTSLRAALTSLLVPQPTMLATTFVMASTNVSTTASTTASTTTTSTTTTSTTTASTTTTSTTTASTTVSTTTTSTTTTSTTTVSTMTASTTTASPAAPGDPGHVTADSVTVSRYVWPAGFTLGSLGLLLIPVAIVTWMKWRKGKLRAEEQMDELATSLTLTTEHENTWMSHQHEREF